MAQDPGNEGLGNAWPEMGERYDWIDLYTQRHACSDTYRALMEEQEALLDRFRLQGIEQLQGLASVLRQQPAEAGAENPESFLDFLASREQELRAGQEELVVQPFNFGVAMQELDKRADDNTQRYERVQRALNTRHMRIGDTYELDGETPPEHIVRAIGYPNSGVARIWAQVCGAIEGFRFATGETRDDVTLGIGLGEAWSQDALSHVVNDIHYLQLMQITLSSSPVMVAEAFGRAEMLQKLGMPPVPTSENLNWDEGSWLHNALQYLQAIEPHHAGLQIDTPGRRLG